MNLCYDLLDDVKLEEFEMIWRKLIFKQKNFHLDELAIIREIAEAAVARNRILSI